MHFIEIKAMENRNFYRFIAIFMSDNCLFNNTWILFSNFDH